MIKLWSHKSGSWNLHYEPYYGYLRLRSLFWSFKGESGILKPKYDSQEEIYTQLY
jgi:hypothetical protein